MNSQWEVQGFALGIRGARSVLGWSQSELARRSGVSRLTVVRIEGHLMQPKLETATRLRHALREGGVAFEVMHTPIGVVIRLEEAGVKRVLAEGEITGLAPDGKEG
jgi:DNA-binding XRE family transcriptional regulator